MSNALDVSENAPWDEIAQRLREQADRDTPPAWMHENVIGAELLGVIVDVNPAAPSKFGLSPVVTIETPTGELFSLWLLHKVLKMEFVRAAPAIGEMVLVRYQGKVMPDGGGNAYESYKLVVDRPTDKSIDWKDIAARYGEELALEPANTPLPEGGFGAADSAEDDIPF